MSGTEANAARMRALLDTNLFISFLLSRTRLSSAVGAILAAAATGRFVLLFTPSVGDEIVRKVAERADLAARITDDDVAQLLANLGEIAETIPRIQGPLPALCRDPKDDYLIAHAKTGGADYLVSWDTDLRDMGQVDRVRIVSPSEFLHVLRDAGLL